jgi:hypothetical protein
MPLKETTAPTSVRPFAQRRDFLRDVESLPESGWSRCHNRLSRRSSAGKNAISRAPDIAASDLTWVWSIAARITFGFSNA